MEQRPGRLLVKDWERFQHYKHRRPPWIKLYRTLLDDYDFLRLQAASMALAPLVWLLASEADGTVSSNVDELAFRLRIDRATIASGLQGLVEAGFLIGRLQDASTMLATCLQHATPERETEREREIPPTPPVGGRGSRGRKPRGRKTAPTPDVVKTDPNIKRVLDSYCLGYQEKHMVMPTLQWGRAGTAARELLSSGNAPKLVALVAYWWGKAPLRRQVESGFSAFYFLVQHFDAMYASLKEGGVDLDLDSPTLPVARFFSDPPQGQDASGEVAAVSGDSR